MLKEALHALRTFRSFALLGASAEPGKYGHKVLAALKAGYRVFPVNPRRAEIEGERCYASYAELPETPDGVILALAPAVTEALVPQLIAQGARMIWLPPECFTDEAAIACEKAGIPVVYDICPVAALASLRQQAARSARPAPAA